MGESAEPLRLPGYGRLLDVRRTARKKFPLAVIDEGYYGPLVPLREYTIMTLMNTITDKADWQQKIYDDGIVKKWRREAGVANSEPDEKSEEDAEKGQEWEKGDSLSRPKAQEIEVDYQSQMSDAISNNSAFDVEDSSSNEISGKMFDWAIAEVKYKAELDKKWNCVEALDGVWKSDTAITEEIRQELIKAVSPLENVPDKEKDWHPGSNQQVLDLVHPSIYPLVYGQSQILPHDKCGVDDCLTWIGRGELLARAKDCDTVKHEYSGKYQWLPAEFSIPAGSEDVAVKSYINNIHPEHNPELYQVIPKVISKAIPLWNLVLSRVQFGIIPPRVSDWSNSNGSGYVIEDEPEQKEGEDDEAYWDRVEEWRGNRDVIEPEPTEFKTPSERMLERKIEGMSKPDRRDPPDTHPSVDLRKDFGNLQIIVKLANICLTPDKPAYPGGSWHVEGQANESICATAIYYYSSENTTDSFLSFRQQVDDGEDLPYEQNDFHAMEAIYGFENDGPTIQNLGYVLTREERLLCFPNVMQHRVAPFQLADATKPGHRKILALFLVDPNFKIISTENIPPQQHAWWKEMVEKAGVIDKLPPELTAQVLNSSDFPISLHTAREQREELMDERRTFVKSHNQEFMESRTFSLCEH